MRITHKQILYVWEKYPELVATAKSLIYVICGIWPTTDILMQYHINPVYFFFGLAGKGVIVMYNVAQKGEYPHYSKNVILMACHLVVAGFVSILVTGYVHEYHIKEDGILIVIVGVVSGMFYELIIKSLIKITATLSTWITTKAINIAKEIIKFENSKNDKK